MLLAEKLLILWISTIACFFSCFFRYSYINFSCMLWVFFISKKIIWISSPFVFVNREIVDYFTRDLLIYQRWLYFRIMVSIACFVMRTRECHRLNIINCFHAAYSHFWTRSFNCCYSIYIFFILRSNINCEG